MNGNKAIVIKDNVELKNLIAFRDSLCKEFDGDDLTVFSPANIDERFKNEVKFILGKEKVNFESWPKGKFLLGLAKGTQFLRNFLFFIKTYNKSFSSRQKLLLLVGFRLETVLSLNLENRTLPTFLTGIAEFFLRTLDRLIFIGCWRKKKCFNKIILMRSDSSHNLAIYWKHALKNTEIVTFVRNVDTITMKGPFSVPSHKTFVTNRQQATRLKDLHSLYSYGDVCFASSKLDMMRPKENENTVRVLYASSHPKFVPGEEYIVDKVLQVLKEAFGDRLVFSLRLHVCDAVERYSILNGNVILSDSEGYAVKYRTEHGDASFFDRNGVLKLQEALTSNDVIISTTSSIMYDAFNMGVKKLIYITDDRFVEYSSLYKREHLSDIINLCQVKSCDDLDRLTELFESRL